MPTSTRGREPVVDEEFLGALYKGGELLASGKIIEAREHLEKAHDLEPRNEKAQNLLGLAYFKLGLFDRASEVYERLVNENPADATLRVNLGLVYLKTNNLERCIKEFETATELEPEHKKAHNYLGLALAQQGTYEKARHHFVLAGSEQMAEKMARALSVRTPSSIQREPPRQEARTVVIGEDLDSPSEGEETIEVMSDEVPSDMVSVSEEVSLRPAPIHSDWGAQLQSPSAPESTAEIRFAEDEGPAEQLDAEAPVVAGEELPVLDAVAVETMPEPGAVSAPEWLTAHDGNTEGSGWVTKSVADVRLSAPETAEPIATQAASQTADESSWAAVNVDQALPPEAPSEALGMDLSSGDPTPTEQAVWEAAQSVAQTTPQEVWTSSSSSVRRLASDLPRTIDATSPPMWHEPSAQPVSPEPVPEPVDRREASMAPQTEWSEESEVVVSYATSEPMTDASHPADETVATAPAQVEETQVLAEAVEQPDTWSSSTQAEGLPPEPIVATWSDSQTLAMNNHASWTSATVEEPAATAPASGVGSATEQAWQREPGPIAPQWAEESSPSEEAVISGPETLSDAESNEAPERTVEPMGTRPTGIWGVPQHTTEVPDDESWATGVRPSSGSTLQSRESNDEQTQWATEQVVGVYPTPAPMPVEGLSAEDSRWSASSVAETSAAMAATAAAMERLPQPTAPMLTAPESAAPVAAPPGYAPMSPRRLVDLGAAGSWVHEPTTGPFHVGPDGLAVTVNGEMLSRMDGLVAVVGSLAVEPENRRRRGRPTSDPFGAGPLQMQRIKGHGVVYLETGRSKFHAVDLSDQQGTSVDDEGAYVREEMLFAFEEPVFFENGRLSTDGQSLELVHLKGTGRILLQLDGTLRAMPIPLGAPMVVPLQRIVGWFGRVTPRLMGFGGRGAVELTGEGFALLGTPAERT